MQSHGQVCCGLPQGHQRSQDLPEKVYFCFKMLSSESWLYPPLSTGKSWYSEQGSSAAAQPQAHNRTELHTINGYINGSLPGESWWDRNRDRGGDMGAAGSRGGARSVNLSSLGKDIRKEIKRSFQVMDLLGCVHLREGLVFQLLDLPLPFTAGQEPFPTVCVAKCN